MAEQEERDVCAVRDAVEQHRLSDVAAAAVAVRWLVRDPQDARALCGRAPVRFGSEERLRPQARTVEDAACEGEAHRRTDTPAVAARPLPPHEFVTHAQ